jgi:hypothetical protein
MKVRITHCPTADSGLQVEGNQATPISDSMVMLGGDSHEQGGTNIQYNGQQVEAEKGEPVSIGNKGEAIVWGNMNIPGTSKKFKTVAKNLGEKEAKYDKVDIKANALLADNSPDDKYDRLSYNAGRIMQIGASYGQKDINQKKEQLAGLQKALLQTAQEHNYDPQELSKGNLKKAKKGAFMPYKKILADDGFNGPGDPNDPNNPINQGSRSDKNNNPGNIKYGAFAKKYGAKQDADGFAVFPDSNTGHTAMQDLLTGGTYKNLPVSGAITKWTGGKPYSLTGLGDLQGKKVSDLSPDELGTVMNYMKQGEGTKYGTGVVNPDTVAKNSPLPGGNYKATPYSFTEDKLPDIPLTPDQGQPAPQNQAPPPLGDVNVPDNNPIPTNAQQLDLKQLLSELYGFATNKQVPVALQKYRPQMYVPYQMSYQDRLNDNQSTFNSQLRQLGANPAAISALGAGKYNADNSVRAEEFRTNQGLQQEAINKNVGISNEAQLKNLSLADTQFVRQAQAKSNTREINQAILNTISDKYLQNNLQTKTLQAYENLYNYRFGDQGRANYYGPNASFNSSGNKGQNSGAADPNARVVRDAQGNVLRTVTPNQQSLSRENLLNIEDQYKIIQDRRKAYKTYTPPQPQ